MKIFAFLSLFLALTIVGCSNDDYYDLNEVASGNNVGGGDTNGNGFTFKDTFYTTTQMFRQGGTGITFTPPATDNAGSITVLASEEEFAQGRIINVGTTGVINITPLQSNPAGVQQTQTTGGTVTITALDTDAKTVDLTYNLETADGNAVGKFAGSYTVQ